jgi:HlyD family type I secretion membrane fusion protein
MNVRVTTESGVVGPGEPILDIVPAESKLIVDARVKPIDIDTIQPGMRARVLLTAYRQRSLPQIQGILRSISADRLTDNRSGEVYFLAKVEVDQAELARLKDVRMSPGMPADVMILTGEQTLLDYFLRPLLDSVTKGFREQ